MKGMPLRPPVVIARSPSSWGDGADGGGVEVRETSVRPAGVAVGAGVGGTTLARRAAPRLWRRTAVLLLADASALAMGCGAAVLVWEVLYEAPSLLWPWPAVAMSALCLAAYAASGLYDAFPLPPVEEVHRSIRAATGALLAMGLSVLALPGSDVRVALVGLPVVWLHVVVLSPVLRAAARARWAPRPWWGCPVVVLGVGGGVRRVVRMLQLQPELGLRPVVVLHDDPAERVRVSTLTDLPAPGALSLGPSLAARGGMRYAVVAFSQAEDHLVAGVIERHGRLFRRLLVVPDLQGVASLWVGARDVGGALGFEIRNWLLVPWRRRLKRVLDTAAAGVGLLLLSPLLLVLAVAIRLDSEGPVLFVQDRLGRGGRCFRLLKFRTMHVGAHERLREVLERDPAARAEYERFAKLRVDPRVTRVGRVLRRCSLDELPQLFNVVRGEMTLVGPRAYLPEELPRMVGEHRGILRVLPGITGLWQVSGRNELPFDMRLELDIRYVRNWSFSLDLYVLARTVPTVLFQRGAA